VLTFSSLRRFHRSAYLRGGFFAFLSMDSAPSKLLHNLASAALLHL
jgi:hypothetical protein